MTSLGLVQTAVMLAFLGAFIGMLLWLLRPGARSAAQRHAEIPFREAGPAEAAAPRNQGDGP